MTDEVAKINILLLMLSLGLFIQVSRIRSISCLSLQLEKISLLFLRVAPSGANTIITFSLVQSEQIPLTGLNDLACPLISQFIKVSAQLISVQPHILHKILYYFFLQLINNYQLRLSKILCQQTEPLCMFREDL